MVAVLSRMFGLQQMDMVLDTVQDTFEAALQKWRFSGIPGNPSGWLMQVAKNKALNTLKRAYKTRAFSPSVYAVKFDESVEKSFDVLLSPEEIKDSQLRLLFTCCHPDLPVKSQMIITLYLLCGFGVPEIANALLMKEEAVKKSLTRIKASLRKRDDMLQHTVSRKDERMKTVLTILYLMFNEGYKTTRRQEAICHDLCYEAIRLVKVLENDHYEANHEINALLALMFFTVSRFPARLGPGDEWLTLEEQDRNKWNTVFMEEGYHYLRRSTRSDTVTRFHIEALIASLHGAAPTFDKTDWEKITALYRQLEYVEPSPMVTLNRIIAESYLDPSGSIQALEELERHSALKNNFLLPAAKAYMYTRRGELKNALICYEQALHLSVSPADRKFLTKKIIEINKGKKSL